MMKFDVTIIGSGPGGYVAAIRCAQLGLKTAIIEKEATLGGTCLNVGCIPSKALLDSSEKFFEAQHKFSKHGIDISKVQVNFPQMMARKQAVVDQMVQGVNFLMKKNKVEIIKGLGSIQNARQIKVQGEKEVLVDTNKIIIATGSEPGSLSSVDIDEKRILSSTGALALGEIPKHLIVIGGGVIGLELSSVYNRLGARVSVIEYADGLIAGMDKSLGKEMAKIMKKQGVDFYLGHAVSGVKSNEKSVIVSAKGEKGVLQLEGDYCLVSVGRKPYTHGLGLENIGIELDDRGRIPVDRNLQTKADGVFAIGDVIQGAMLAHKAEEEGIFVAETIAGQKPHIDYNLIPGVVYTWPEIAGVGQTEEQLKQNKTDYKVGQFPFRANGRAVAGMDPEGFVKILSDKKSDEVLGVHIIGARAADMIMEAVTAMEFRASAEDIARISHAHPTTSEVMKEAALAATGNRALHN
ncbi:MAG: dihydrolipoyl dehydrogenase [Bacteroidota bacterium]|nr:dihydrolipoyl dehydrogenase [Bacteroidota bacterium]